MFVHSCALLCSGDYPSSLYNIMLVMYVNPIMLMDSYKFQIT